ncbi:ABC-type transport auxiliary lipoprotein family protein [Aromatoleum buckelii]|uniref:ABC-type transport auxiliary lipoprotein component domain-containing protein n=1 Tax=Aromatoleum buckelii TaxID=200254 RepID=A0ABX1MYV3_9RHOO|nr:ABC-type transport auxiliary lipoprotein family protein [Aromatoleum buckelii]MCK0513083.1 PqiC family protein [Aromatoleum buckelii]
MLMSVKAGRAGLLVLALAAAVGGCGNLGVPAERFTFFDLGLVEPVEPALEFPPERVEVRAPSWLSTGAMQYRLDYRQPAQREAYSETRWVAEPGEMLRVALDRALTGNRTADGECRLRVELDEFVQVFDSRQSSHAKIVARAALLAPRSDAELSHRTLVVSEPAPTPDAAGGVIAFRRAVQRLAHDVSLWLASLDPAAVEGLNTSGRCER